MAYLALDQKQKRRFCHSAGDTCLASALVANAISSSFILIIILHTSQQWLLQVFVKAATR